MTNQSLSTKSKYSLGYLGFVLTGTLILGISLFGCEESGSGSISNSDFSSETGQEDTGSDSLDIPLDFMTTEFVDIFPVEYRFCFDDDTCYLQVSPGYYVPAVSACGLEVMAQNWIPLDTVSEWDCGASDWLDSFVGNTQCFLTPNDNLSLCLIEVYPDWWVLLQHTCSVGPTPQVPIWGDSWEADCNGVGLGEGYNPFESSFCLEGTKICYGFFNGPWSVNINPFCAIQDKNPVPLENICF